MNKRVVFLLILGLFLLTFVNAIPPVQTTIVADVGLEISATNFDYHKQNEYHTFRFRVYNTSSQEYFNDEEVNCSFGLINSRGDYVFNQIPVVTDDYLFVVNVTGGNFSEVGAYHEGINCITDDGTIGAFPKIISFEVTPTGEELTTAKAILQLGFIALLILLLLADLFSIMLLPDKTTKDGQGLIMDFGNLKYLRPLLLLVAWVILLAIFFLASNIAIAYLTAGMFGSFLFVVYKIMFVLTLPIIFVWFIWIFVKMFQDREIKSMLERGVSIGEI